MADIAGCSRLTGTDEEGTIDRLWMVRRELFDPTIAAHGGRTVKTTGDGIPVEFASVVDAGAACAGGTAGDGGSGWRHSAGEAH